MSKRIYRLMNMLFILLISLVSTSACNNPIEHGSTDTNAVTCIGATQRLIGAYLWQDGVFMQRDIDINNGVFVNKGHCGNVQEMLNFKGKWITPPFGDFHNHQIESPFMFESFNKKLLGKGIFYVFNPNADPRLIKRLEPLLNKPDAIDLISTLGGLTAKYGHPQGGLSLEVAKYLYPGQNRNDLDGYVFHSVDQIEDIEPVLNRLQLQGATWIKIYLHKSSEYHERKALVTDKAVNDGLRYSKPEYMFGLNPDLVNSIVSQAHQRQLKVTAHVTTAFDVEVAINAKVDALAHLPGAYVLDERDFLTKQLNQTLLNALADSKILITPTFSARPDLTPERLQPRLIEYQRKVISELHKAGATLLLGADNFQYDASNEYEYWLDKRLMQSSDLLELWINTGSYIFPSKNIGQLRNGFIANFLVFDADPSVNKNALTSLQAVYKNGNLIALD